MRALCFFIFYLCLSFWSTAQTVQDEFELVQELYGMDKRDIFEAFIGDDVDKDFWGLYKEYEDKRKVLGNERFSLLKDYSKDYLNMSDESSSLHLKRALKLNLDYNRLIRNHSKKIEKAYGAKIAVQFYQLEQYFLALTRTELIENMATMIDILKED